MRGVESALCDMRLFFPSRIKDGYGWLNIRIIRIRIRLNVNMDIRIRIVF